MSAPTARRSPSRPATFDATASPSFATSEGARAAGSTTTPAARPRGREAGLIMICGDHANMLPATDGAATIVAGPSESVVVS